MQQVKIIQAFNLVDMLKEVRQASLEGYDYDFSTIEHFPQQFGLHFYVPMVKGQKENPEKVQEKSQEDEQEVVSEVQSEEPPVEPQRRGRKKGA